MKNKIKIISSAFAFIILLISFPVSVFAQGEISGSGTADDPYLVENAADLQYMQLTVLTGQSYAGKYFVQSGDIDMSGVDDWETIGCLAAGKNFSGIYDGRGCSIRNLKCDGVFSSLFDSLSGTVVNLKVENFVLNGDCGAGIAANVNGGGKIAGCYVSGNFSSSASGGIAYNNNGVIVNCYSNSVYSNKNYGSLCYSGSGKTISCGSADQQIKGKDYKGLAFKTNIVDKSYFTREEFVKDYNKNAYDAVYFNGSLFKLQMPLEYFEGQVKYANESKFSIFSLSTVRALWAYILIFDIAAAAVIGIIILTNGSLKKKTEESESNTLNNPKKEIKETV